ncbi:hypothetical protein PENPOL_c020G07497 [Penicillium polonicum]|uniref:Uncharacterized protein n=1 Tax=Penicillium polonicum TaxID=60169 RepID=A0A1V6N816_PENPO|nr:hypothetical protein PENPOL_c020G07497 [Penicillium polonicum]
MLSTSIGSSTTSDSSDEPEFSLSPRAICIINSIASADNPAFSRILARREKLIMIAFFALSVPCPICNTNTSWVSASRNRPRSYKAAPKFDELSIVLFPGALGREEVWSAPVSQLIALLSRETASVGGGFVRLNDLYKQFLCLLWSLVICKIQISLAKISVCLFLLRIFQSSTFRYLTYTLIGINAAIGIIWALVDYFRCLPTRLAWTGWTNEESGQCINFINLTFVNCLVNIFVDSLMIVIPVYEVTKLQLPLRKKLTVALMFIVGFVLTIIAKIRVVVFWKNRWGVNQTLGLYPLVHWSVIETQIAIMCACLPAFRALLLQGFPAIQPPMALTVAVAGATGAVGKTIVEQILNENKFSVVALTRRGHIESPVSNVQYVQTDYDDHTTLVQQLERHAIQTVICAIGMLGDDCSQAQISLIKAADEASTVERFITSEFGYFTREERRHIDPGVDWFLEAANLLKHSKLTYTRPVCGAFMDFLGMPYARSNIAPMNIVVDVLNREAYIPGDGNTPITMIYSYDAATLVAKLLEVDEWSEFSFCNGDDTTLSEVLRIAEDVCGEKFRVTYLKAEEVEKGNIPILEVPDGSGIQPNELLDYSVFGYQLYLARGFQLPDEGRIGNRFPGFKPRTVRDF